MRTVYALCLGLCLFALSACYSTPLSIPTAPLAPNEKVLGPTQGNLTGFMIMGFIPVRQNDRFVEAYDRALGKLGGTRLIDVTISERWWWGYVLNGYNFQVNGTAVGPK